MVMKHLALHQALPSMSLRFWSLLSVLQAMRRKGLPFPCCPFLLSPIFPSFHQANQSIMAGIFVSLVQKTQISNLAQGWEVHQPHIEGRDVQRCRFDLVRVQSSKLGDKSWADNICSIWFILCQNPFSMCYNVQRLILQSVVIFCFPSIFHW